MGTFIDPQGAVRMERRTHRRLREIFPDARIRINHFFHSVQYWAGSPIDYLAQRVIHEAYPELNAHEIRMLVRAIEDKY